MAFPDASRSSLNCTIQLSCVDLLLINVVLVLPTGSGLFTPLCPWLVCWKCLLRHRALVLGSSSSVTWGWCCFRSFIFVPFFFCKFSVPQWDRGWSGCSAELQQNIPVQNMVSKTREMVTTTTGHCSHWMLSERETPWNKGVKGKCFPFGCVSQGMCEMQDWCWMTVCRNSVILCLWELPWRRKGVQNPHKPCNSRSRQAAERGLLDAEWELFVFLVDWSSCR